MSFVSRFLPSIRRKISKTFRVGLLFGGLGFGFVAVGQVPELPRQTVGGGPVAAFPGAQGGGAVSKGGRSGRVILVTNLSDSGSGSLRDCVQASGPRTCIFRVSGTIELQTQLYPMPPYLTVAGQTAPGGGILISGKNLVKNVVNLSNTNNVIWRYTRVRKGYKEGGNNDGGTINMYNSHTMMIDHNSTSWNQDEGIGVWSDKGVVVNNMTISHNLVAEGLAGHSTAMLVGGAGASSMTDIDIHHNLMMNDTHRNPLLNNKSSRVVSNLIYNNGWDAMEFSGGLAADVIGNILKPGPLNITLYYWPWPWHEVKISKSDVDDANGDRAPGDPSVFLSGNIGWNQSNPAGDPWLIASQIANATGPEQGPVPAAWRRTTPLPKTPHPIVAEPVGVLEGSLLPVVGASRRLACDGTWVSNRDSVDARLINQYKNDTGISAIPVTESDVGGFPVIGSGTPCADADSDGMPDVWEQARGFNPNAYNPNLDADGDGYTNLEEYLNGSQL